MKKNCFLYTVIFGTILIGSLIYVVENYFYDLFVEESKEFVISEIEQNWKTGLISVKNSNEKDSLKVLIKEFVSQFNEPKNFLLTSSFDQNFVENISESLEDSLITEIEIKKISDLLLKVKNEKLESN